jgi:16S rRNA (guanine(966)-N(2))-methyltransferase RsmD
MKQRKEAGTVRVISGMAKGRGLKSVPGMSTRPTTDKVKEAVFSMIGPFFESGTVLDLFAGTGALGIEALSRGMERAIFVDLHPKSIEVIRSNLRATGLEDRAEVYRNDAARAVKALHKRGMRFNLVFLDPPYRMMCADLAEFLDVNRMLLPESDVVIEHAADREYPDQIGGMGRRRFAVYGDTAVSIYSCL